MRIVVMCVWKRPECLPWTLSCLRGQLGPPPALYLWNNAPESASQIERIIDRHAGDLSTTVHHSDENVGGIGRFLMALRFGLSSGPIVFIDDDQFLRPDFLEHLYREHVQETICGGYAFRFSPGESYWNKIRCKSAERAHYIGTGGMILDPALLTKPEFLANFPMQFRRVEDLWLSYFALRHGYVLRAVEDRTLPILDGKNSWRELRAAKADFLSWLRVEGGWNV